MKRRVFIPVTILTMCAWLGTALAEPPPIFNLKWGSYGTTPGAFNVPRAVAQDDFGYVYVLDSNNIAQLRYVTLGSSHGDAVEVLSGIAAKEKLVEDPADRDLGGKRIEVQP